MACVVHKPEHDHWSELDRNGTQAVKLHCREARSTRHQTRWLWLASFSLLIAPLLIAPAGAEAQEVEAVERIDEGPVSLGLGFGDPAAVDAKFWTPNNHGLDIGIGIEDFDNVLGVYGEFEFGLVEFMARRTLGVFYLGPGAALAFFEDGLSLAAVVPIGVDFRFPVPLDLFIEARPGIQVVDDPAEFGIGGQVGLRYVF